MINKAAFTLLKTYEQQFVFRFPLHVNMNWSSSLFSFVNHWLLLLFFQNHCHMAKFLSRLFRSNSLSKNESFRSSQGSLNDNSNRARSSSNIRTTASLENFSSYHVIPKELEKNKLHKASWDGNLNKVVRLARPGQINVKDQQQRVWIFFEVIILLIILLKVDHFLQH